MKIALLQMTSGVDPTANAAVIEPAIADAAAQGAVMLFTPEMSGLLDSNGARAANHVVAERDDLVLARVRAAAAAAGIWVHLGSLAVKSDGEEPRWANRGFVIDAAGEIAAHYDKLHLFDVDLPTGESWRESSRYVPGPGTSLIETPVGKLGLSICYDMRFPALFQTLSGAGATILSVPAAFTVPTGQAHWHTLLRARAIENQCYVLASAQGGTHLNQRRTWGHSMLIDPWGDVFANFPEGEGFISGVLCKDKLNEVRSKLPALTHRKL